MRKLIQHRSDFLQLGDVFNKTKLRFRDAEDERHFVRHCILAAGNVGGSEGKNRQIACKPLLAVVADQSDSVTAFDSVKRERGSKSVHFVMKLSIGDRLECSLLVLAELHGDGWIFSTMVSNSWGIV